MSLMPSIAVLVAEMCLSRLGRLPSSYLLLAICRSRVFWKSLFLSFKPQHSCTKPRPKQCGGVPREAGHTVTMRGQMAEHGCVDPPSPPVKFFPRSLSTQDDRRKAASLPVV